MKKNEEKPILKNGKKIKRVVATFTVAVMAVVGSLFLASCSFGKNNTSNINKPQTEYNGGNGNTNQNGDNNETPKPESVNKIEKAVVDNTDYDNFTYNYTTYTYVDGNPTVQVNGTTKRDGKDVYITLSYTVDSDTYESYIGYELSVEKKNEKYLISNNNSNKTEEEVLLLNNLTASIAEAQTTSVKEMTYEENLENTVSYLRKKVGLVLGEGFKMTGEDLASQTFRVYVYFDINGCKNGLEFDYYAIYIEQLKIDMDTLIDSNGNELYIFDHSKTYSVQRIKKRDGVKIFTPSEYLDLYINYNGPNRKIYDSVKNKATIKDTLRIDHMEIYDSFEQER